MGLVPKLNKAFRLNGDPDSISHDLVSGLPRSGVSIQQHYPGSRICGSVMRPLSLSGGQRIRIDFHPMAGGEVEVCVESKFRFPGLDFTHQNEKNLALVEDVLQRERPAA